MASTLNNLVCSGIKVSCDGEHSAECGAHGDIR